MRFRTLALGDVHGCSAALLAVLAAADVRADDLVVAVGDYIDRGPDSAGVIDALIDLGRRCHFMPVRGNHDAMMLDARADDAHLRRWFSLGGDATLRSYGPGATHPGLDAVPADHWDFLGRTCVDSVATATHLFVHGGVLSGVPVERHAPDQLQWTPFPPPVPHGGGRIVVCGHTAQRDGRPASVGHAICIDTDVDRPGGWLTMLDVATGRYWQANQAGEVRTGAIVASGG